MQIDDTTMVSIVVPTFEEAGNLSALVERIAAAMSGVGFEIIVVDDASADDTPTVCRHLAKRHPLSLLVRRNRAGGLSAAILEGFSVARGEIVVVMDADLQHPPESIPALVRPLILGNADFVLGSRRVAGGDIDPKWGAARWLSSSIARLLAAPLAWTIKDPMSGFFAVRRDALPPRNSVRPVGYKIALELMCTCKFQRIVEVPIAFCTRQHGRSKLGNAERINYLRHLGRLYGRVVLTWLRGARVPTADTSPRLPARTSSIGPTLGR